MVKGRCPICDALVEIVPGDRQHPERSSRWWHPVLHPDGKGGVCYGKKI